MAFIVSLIMISFNDFLHSKLFILVVRQTDWPTDRWRDDLLLRCVVASETKDTINNDTKERKKEGKKERKKERKNERINEWKNEWMKERMNERKNEEGMLEKK